MTSVGVVAAPARSAERTSRSTRSATAALAAVGLQALDVEAEPLGVRPDVRVVDPALVGVDGVVQLPERVLPRGRLGRAWASGTARGWRRGREVAEDVAHAARRAGAPQRRRSAGT